MLGDSKVHAIVPTHDLATARRFYEDKLGAKVAQEMRDGGGLVLACGEGSEFLLYQTQVKIPAEHTTMFFRVANVDDAVADLESRGVTFEVYDLESMGFEGMGSGKIIRTDEIATAFFKDPEGNIISVTEMLS